jgi:hypothetical protein
MNRPIVPVALTEALPNLVLGEMIETPIVPLKK